LAARYKPEERESNFTPGIKWRCFKSFARHLPHPFRTNIFPGNCFTSRFISRLNNATLTAELGRPLARMI
jgi:hypothetical protein